MPSVTTHFSVLLHKKEESTAPALSTSTAVLLLVAYTLLYVIPFYLWPKTRPSPTLSRDAPSVIRARITSVTITCVVASLTTSAILATCARHAARPILHALGYWPVGLAEASRALLLTAALFLGPLFEALVVEGTWRRWLTLQPAMDLLADMTAWRDMVAGPLTEEILFRSAAIPLMLVARTPLTETILVSPLVFGLAHVHHFYEFRITRPAVPAGAALLRSVFQLAYTTLFGAYATFLYLRTGSLLAVFVVHALCNCMGLPRVSGRVSGRAEDGSPVTVAKAWSLLYYVLLMVGAAAWWRGLWPLTESGNALVAV